MVTIPSAVAINMLHAAPLIACWHDERGEITEGSRSNLFIKLNGRWFTPPLFAGLLPGVMRAAMLEDQALDASERCFGIDELRGAEDVDVCKARRGWLQADIFADEALGSPQHKSGE